MSSPAPPVSIGIPVYNGARYLPIALDSLLAQSWEDFEIVISDNCSTDATLDICADYAARDSRIRLLRTDHNRGAAYNYNRVFHQSRGVYFKWAAADDAVAPGMIERCVLSLESRPACALAYPRTMIIDANGAEVCPYDDSLHIAEDRPSDRFIALVRRVRECNAVFGLIRRELLARTALIGPFLGSDVSLLAEVSLYGHFHEIPERLFFRREHEGASSCQHSLREQLSFFSPRLRSRPAWLHWRLFIAHWQAAMRADIGHAERMRCLCFLASRFRKNRDIYLRELAGSLRRGAAPVPTRPVRPLSPHSGRTS
jgi:glycosyltransferase involved in cell wall biosynthesis